MDLQGRLSALITAIGADIRYLRNRESFAASIANQTLGVGDTLLTGSVIPIPTGKIQAQSIYRVRFNMVKTAAGIAAPVVTVRVGTAGTIADTARATLTFAAQTAVVDEGVIEVDCVFRASGATAVIQALGKLYHRLVTTGLNITANLTFVLNTGAAFDVTPSNSKISLSVNAGASSAWTVSVVTAELLNLAP